MKKKFINIGLLCLIFVLCTAAVMQKDPLSVTAKLSIKDDRGQNWVLKNANEYKVKWSLSDASPYQHYELYPGPSGLVFAQSFEELIAMNTNTGKTVWKKNSDWEGGVHPTIGSDGSYYTMSSAEGKQLSPDVFQTNISRIGKDGVKTIFSSINIQVNKSLIDSHQAGDSKGNFIILTDKGLLSIKPDGSTNWLLAKINISKGSLDPKNMQGLFTDLKGNIFVMFENRMVSLSFDGTINWARVYPLGGNPSYSSVTPGGYLLKKTFSKDLSSYDSKLYNMTDKGLTEVKELSIINNQVANSDHSGGVYKLDEKTNTVKDQDYFTGKLKWNYSLSKYERQGGLSLFQGNLRTDSKGNVFFGNNAGTVYSLDNKGKPRFILFMKNAIMAYADILPINENSVVLTVNNHIVCIEKINQASLSSKTP